MSPDARADYRDILPLAQARKLVLRELPDSRDREVVGLEKADGRVLAAGVRASADVPGFPRSTVDGYAVVAADTFGAGESAPVTLFTAGRVQMGHSPSFTVGPGRAGLIPTGGMLPAGTDAVVLVEHSVTPGEGLVEVSRPVAPGENVVRAGEDVAAGSLVFEAGRRLTPADLGVLAAVGVTQVSCYGKPRVAIIPTGDEIVPAGASPGPGQVRDITSAALVGYVARDGGATTVHRVVTDAEGSLETALGRVLEDFDLILVLGGSSVGGRDRTAGVIDALGPPGVVFHGLALKPGKPTIFGFCGPRKVPVFGLPGHPVSSLVVYRFLVRPVLRVLGGEVAPEWETSGGGAPTFGERTLTVRLAVSVSSDQGRDEYLCVRLRPSPEGLVAEPVPGKSGLITMLAGADGLVPIPAGQRGLEKGTMVEVLSLV